MPSVSCAHFPRIYAEHARTPRSAQGAPPLSLGRSASGAQPVGRSAWGAQPGAQPRPLRSPRARRAARLAAPPVVPGPSRRRFPTRNPNKTPNPYLFHQQVRRHLCTARRTHPTLGQRRDGGQRDVPVHVREQRPGEVARDAARYVGSGELHIFEHRTRRHDARRQRREARRWRSVSVPVCERVCTR